MYHSIRNGRAEKEKTCKINSQMTAFINSGWMLMMTWLVPFLPFSIRYFSYILYSFLFFHLKIFQLNFKNEWFEIPFLPLEEVAEGKEGKESFYWLMVYANENHIELECSRKSLQQ